MESTNKPTICINVYNSLFRILDRWVDMSNLSTMFLMNYHFDHWQYKMRVYYISLFLLCLHAQLRIYSLGNATCTEICTNLFTEMIRTAHFGGPRTFQCVGHQNEWPGSFQYTNSVHISVHNSNPIFICFKFYTLLKILQQMLSIACHNYFVTAGKAYEVFN